VARADRLTAEQLTELHITGANGTLVPLSTFATLRTTAEPRELKKFQQLNAVRIQGVIPPPVPLDQALGFLENEAQALLPQGFALDYAGESRQLRAEGSRFLGVFLLSAIQIYLVLAAQFESFRDPFIILAGSVPLALSGALMFSFLGWTSLNIYSQVGLITLVGLVAKNGILIVQFAEELRERGMPIAEAAVEAARIRLRPILMTSLAFILGVMPLVFASGAGREARHSVGTAVAGGMFAATFLNLAFIPVLYVVVKSLTGGRTRTEATRE
jgi:multidrug efflux pump